MSWWGDFTKAAAGDIGTKLKNPLEVLSAPSRFLGGLIEGVASTAGGAPVRFTPEMLEGKTIGERAAEGFSGVGEDLAEALYPGIDAQRSALQDIAEVMASMGIEGLTAASPAAGVPMAAREASAALRAVPIRAANAAMRMSPNTAAAAMEAGVETPELLRAASAFAGRQARRAMQAGGQAVRDVQRGQTARDVLGMNKAGDPVRRVWDLTGPRGVPANWSVKPLSGGARGAAEMGDASKLFKARQAIGRSRPLALEAEATVPMAERAMTLRDVAEALQMFNPTLF